MKLKKISEKIGEVKLLRFINDAYFLYDIDNIVKSTSVAKLIKNFLIFGSLTYLGETKNNDEVDLITPPKN